MKYILIALTFFSFCANAQQSTLNKDISAAKKAVIELNQELNQLEQELLSPKGSEVVFYFSLRGSQYFVPLAIEIKSQGLTTVHHIYTEQEVKALLQGAVQPLANSAISAGKHIVSVQIKGVNEDGQPTTLAFENEVEKTTAPLMIEISVHDNKSARKANAQLAIW